MKKSTPAFQLYPVKNVNIVYYPKQKKWYPIEDNNQDSIFIKGLGHKKITKTWKFKIIDSLPDEFTAEQLKNIYNEYGFNVVQGMVSSYENSNHSLFYDHSIYLDYVKYELLNVCKYGKLYDEFTDKFQKIGDEFIHKLYENGYSVKGHFLYYKSKLIDSDIKLHILQYIEHSLFRMVLISPSFDPIRFDTTLRKLILGQYSDYKEANRVLNEEIVSVKDRIKYLSNSKIADDVASIFNWDWNRE